MLNISKVTENNGRILIQDPPIARFLFQSTLASWFWLVVRVFVGWQFLDAGWPAGWFSYVIVGGEIAVGLGLILGAFVGIAAFGGLLMNIAFLLAGTTSTNPVLAVLGIALVLAWKNAGYVGLDRFFLPLIGTPWQRPSVTTERVQLEHQLAA